jgi:hypothetical protein
MSKAYKVEDPLVPPNTTGLTYMPPVPEQIDLIQVSVSVKMPSDPKSKLVMLAAARAAANQRAETARAAADEKREQRKADKVANAKDVRRWFEIGCERYTSLSRLPSWRPQDWSNAKRMLEEFGQDTLEKAVLWFFEHWPKYVEASRGRLNGIPTPSLMIAMKSQVVPDCEMGRIPGEDTSKRNRVRGSEWSEAAKPALNPDEWGLD